MGIPYLLNKYLGSRDGDIEHLAYAAKVMRSALLKISKDDNELEDAIRSADEALDEIEGVLS